MTTELHKLTMSVHRVVKAFQGSYKITDLSAEITGISDTFNKVIHQKLAGIDSKSLVNLIINKAKIVSLVLNDLQTTFNQAKAKGDKQTTWTDLTKLKKDLLNLKQLSTQFSPDILKEILPTIKAMKTKIDQASQQVDKYLLDVRSW